MKVHSLAVLVAGVLAARFPLTGAVAKTDAVKAELKRLEGTWKVVSNTRNGKEVDKDYGDQVVFKGKNMTVKSRKGDQTATVTIDSKKKTIDIVPSENG